MIIQKVPDLADFAWEKAVYLVSSSTKQRPARTRQAAKWKFKTRSIFRLGTIRDRRVATRGKNHRPTAELRSFTSDILHSAPARPTASARTSRLESLNFLNAEALLMKFEQNTGFDELRNGR